MSIGPHAGYMLRLFGAHVDQAFGGVPFHVGSSLTWGKQKRRWRDVDVRLMLDSDTYLPFADHKVRRMHELAWSVFGQQMTGLPIDFQIQEVGAANAEFDGPRSALLLLEDELPIARKA